MQDAQKEWRQLRVFGLVNLSRQMRHLREFWRASLSLLSLLSSARSLFFLAAASSTCEGLSGTFGRRGDETGDFDGSGAAPEDEEDEEDEPVFWDEGLASPESDEELALVVLGGDEGGEEGGDEEGEESAIDEMGNNLLGQ